MKLEEIQEEWKQDSQIDSDNLDEESLRTYNLHSKYYEICNTKKSLLKKYMIAVDVQYKKRFLYWSGKEVPQVYRDEPKDVTLDKSQAIVYTDADESIIKLRNKIATLEVEVDFIESIIDSIKYRNNAIKNAIDFKKWSSGAF